MLNYSFEVTYYDEYGNSTDIVSVRRTNRNKLKELLFLQQQLLDVFFDCDGGVGDILSDERNWQLIRKTAALLPVIGSNTPLNVDAFEYDYTQITRIFFTQSVNDLGEFVPDPSQILKPSLISQLHQFNYNGAVSKSLAKPKQTEPESLPQKK